MAHNINPHCWLYRFGPRHYGWDRGGPPRNTFEKFPGLPLLGPGFRLQQDRFKTAVDDPEECRGRSTQRKPGSETHVVLPCFCQFLFFHEQKKKCIDWVPDKIICESFSQRTYQICLNAEVVSPKHRLLSSPQEVLLSDFYTPVKVHLHSGSSCDLPPALQVQVRERKIGRTYINAYIYPRINVYILTYKHIDI